FFYRLAIEARINPKLQMNMLPLRFRPNMTEFQSFDLKRAVKYSPESVYPQRCSCILFQAARRK
ncbi:MAG: DUF4130 domain-containing protein, partial [Lachnospiraceae bacterium]|nr:DUF4130 domain-containing protein [Lachnospiraceae bacterium]